MCVMRKYTPKKGPSVNRVIGTGLYTVKTTGALPTNDPLATYMIDFLDSKFHQEWSQN